ncbi:glycosyl transferase [Aureimonas endophytica]|uniref:Glycosyl transferase n=1 Tax=Aureimonas endophytica TaxID=2027858 RepID=A0A916ZXD8_9HYPH|nr:glycosyltransferase [Aureimonas endophytica]GGE17804.1 glycosyl transferase [Aureimonas endophytica]
MTILAGLALLAWLVLLFGRGAFWRLGPDMLGQSIAPEGPAPSILAVVPARDEAEVIARTLPSLLAQTYAGRFHVLLVDDGSEDGTAAIARRAAAASGHAERLTVLAARPLPAGWTGKLAAMAEGLAWARIQAETPDLVLFTDADIAYGPGTLARLAGEAAARGTVLASLMVKLKATSPAERLLVPAFVFFFRMLYPFAWVRDPKRRCAAAAGGSMLVDRRALEAAGGLAAIRGALIDDCALGALMKRQGPVWLGLTDEVRSLRDYPRVADIRRMVARSAYTELRHSPLRLVLALAGLGLVFLVPPLAALFGHGAARLFGLLAFVGMNLAFLPMVRFYRAPWWTAPALPAIAAAYALFTLDSALQHWRGRGGAWKGRLQAVPGKTAGT